ncbi:SDR family NAD(P)-dependent oxidoreductase [Nonomuraea sp. KM90]|uniref:SDR family NAD(P)-dependent oxidoreductase n=1 Tax=Nonomuraea sp. KM90 TaxID=3457428 RepID=UPI003FCEAF35
MDLQLTGRRAVVTGASRGIGWAVGRALAAEGAAVALVARSARHVEGGRLASTLGLTPDAVQGVEVSVHTIMADPNPQTLTELAAHAAAGALRVPVTATYALEQAPEAFAAFGAGTLGKIAVTCS